MVLLAASRKAEPRSTVNTRKGHETRKSLPHQIRPQKCAKGIHPLRTFNVSASCKQRCRLSSRVSPTARNQLQSTPSRYPRRLRGNKAQTVSFYSTAPPNP